MCSSINWNVYFDYQYTQGEIQWIDLYFQGQREFKSVLPHPSYFVYTSWISIMYKSLILCNTKGESLVKPGDSETLQKSVAWLIHKDKVWI